MNMRPFPLRTGVDLDRIDKRRGLKYYENDYVGVLFFLNYRVTLKDQTPQ